MSHLVVGEKEIQGTTRTTGNIVNNQISFILKPNDNQAEYRCNATNPATTEPLIATKTLTVNCKSGFVIKKLLVNFENGLSYSMSTSTEDKSVYVRY